MVAFEDGGASHPDGLVVGVSGNGAEDVEVIVGRVGGDLFGSGLQLPFEFVVDGGEEGGGAPSRPCSGRTGNSPT